MEMTLEHEFEHYKCMHMIHTIKEYHKLLVTDDICRQQDKLSNLTPSEISKLIDTLSVEFTNRFIIDNNMDIIREEYNNAWEVLQEYKP